MHKRTYILTSSTLAACAATLVLLWLVGGGLSAHAAPASELHVCPAGCTYSSIQAAVDAANPGDVIKVAQGTYTDVHNVAILNTATFTATQIAAITKSVTIRGGYTTTNWTTPYPITQPTTLDAQGQGRVLVISGDITPTIEGVRITGGDAAGLGGCFAFDAGGGVYIVNASAVISGNLVYSNTAEMGGGLFLYGSPATLDGNTVTSNAVDRQGGGVHLYDSDATLSDNAICDNEGGGEGGGVYIFESDNALLTGNTVDGNTCYNGAGVFLYQSSATLSSNGITGNVGSGRGAGLYFANSDATLTNTVVADNQASIAGNGLHIHYSTIRLLHTTIARNGSASLAAASSAAGSGVNVIGLEWGGNYYPSTVFMTNTIIVSHTVGITVELGSTATLASTLWHGNSTDWGGAGTINQSGDHSGDPAFAADGCHLTAASAAIDKGVDAGVTTDIDGETRPWGAGYDIGADEFLKRIYLPLVLRNYQP